MQSLAIKPCKNFFNLKVDVIYVITAPLNGLVDSSTRIALGISVTGRAICSCQGYRQAEKAAQLPMILEPKPAQAVVPPARVAETGILLPL